MITNVKYPAIWLQKNIKNKAYARINAKYFYNVVINALINAQNVKKKDSFMECVNKIAIEY